MFNPSRSENSVHVNGILVHRRQMLAAGASIPWPDILDAFTGNPKTDPEALLEYFAPLDEWLDEQILSLDIPVGWTSSFGREYHFDDVRHK